MVESILSNKIYIALFSILALLIPFLVCGHHYKKYGILQAIFSIVTVPMLYYGASELACYIFKDNQLYANAIEEIFKSLESVYLLHYRMYEFTGWNWLYNSGYIYMPSIILFVLTYGYSITFYRKRKKKNDKE